MSVQYDTLSCSNGRIAYLAKTKGAERYLEIGVSKGATFFNVDLPFKVAVDPCFQFDPDEHGAPGTHYFPITSDEFFKKLRTGDICFDCGQERKKIRFDIIFIDGLHTFDQSFRDFENSLEFAHDNTIWLIDDTVPSDAYSALPDLNVARYKRWRAGFKPGTWHGDVFKTVFAIHDKYPEFSYCTLVSGNPQTIVWKTKAQGRPPIFSSLAEIASLSYRKMLEHAWLFMPVDNEQFPEYLGKAHNPQKDCASGAREKLSSCSDRLPVPVECTAFDTILMPLTEPFRRVADKIHNEGVVGLLSAFKKRVNAVLRP